MAAALAYENDEIIIGTKEGQAIRFAIDQLRSKGRSTRGVRGIALSK